MFNNCEHNRTVLQITLMQAFFICVEVFASGSPEPKPDELLGLWGDLGDGTFVNPIIPGDYSGR